MAASWRLITGCLFMGLVFAACSPGDAETSTQVANTQTPQTQASGPTSTLSAPDLTEVDKSELVLQVVAHNPYGSRSRVWVYDPAMEYTDATRRAITAAIASPVQFIADESEALGESNRLPQGEIFLSFTKPFKVESDVIGMQVWLSQGPLTGTGFPFRFQWNGQAWNIVIPGPTDTTLGTAVS